MTRARARQRRICMVVHARYPTGEPRVERAALAAHQDGWRVRVVALRHPGEPPREVVDGVEVVRFNVQHKRTRGLFGVLVEYLNFAVRVTGRLSLPSAAWRFDVLQINTPPDFLAIAALIPRLQGTRTILDIHDLSSHMFGARFGDRRGAHILRRGLLAVERMACHVSDRVL